MSKVEDKREICIFAAEPIIYNIKNDKTGERERVVGCKVCYGVFINDECRDMKICKATAGFSEWADTHIGEKFSQEIAFDSFGRAVCLYEK